MPKPYILLKTTEQNQKEGLAKSTLQELVESVQGIAEAHFGHKFSEEDEDVTSSLPDLEKVQSQTNTPTQVPTKIRVAIDNAKQKLAEGNITLIKVALKYAQEALSEFSDETLTKELQEVIKQLEKALETQSKTGEVASAALGITGSSNRGGNDCFVNALYQFLQSPVLAEHLVDNLPEKTLGSLCNK